MATSPSPFQPDCWHPTVDFTPAPSATVPTACQVGYPWPGNNVPFGDPYQGSALRPYYYTTTTTFTPWPPPRLSDEDVERIAKRVAELVRSK